MARVTIQDVAEACGVSPMTVSRVANEQEGVGPETRERVNQAIKKLGYRRNFLARGLKLELSATIGLIIPDITNPYFPEIVRGAEDAALEAGYGVFLSNSVENQRREAATLQLFEERRVDGVVLVSPRLGNRKLHALLRRQRAAVVVNRSVPANVAGVVRLDHISGVEQAIDHIVSLGRKRIGVLAGPVNSFATRERLKGIEASLATRGLSLLAERLIRTAPYVDDGAAAAARLLATAGEVDALLCYNDLVAAGALRACAAVGLRVPQDVAIVGFDDIPFASMFTPSLTTLHVPKYDLGATAMRILLARIGGRHTDAEVVLTPTLVVRDSTVVRTTSASSSMPPAVRVRR